MGPEASSTQALQDLQAQHIQAQHNALMHQAHSNGAHNGQLVLQSSNQPLHSGQSQGHAHQVKGDHGRLFPGLSTADFDPTVPLRLETSTKPKIDLTGATPLEPSNDPKDLRSLFSATVNARKADEDKAGGLVGGKKRERPASFDASMIQKPTKTFGELNKGYQRALSQSHPSPQKKQKVAGTKAGAGGVSGEIVAKEQAPKHTRKPSASKMPPKTAPKDPEPVVDADPPLHGRRELDRATVKALHYAFYLGAFAGAANAVQNQGKIRLKENMMTPEAMDKLMGLVPEFFSKTYQGPAQVSSDSRSGFSPSPKIGVATATAVEQHTPPNVSIPMFDGSGSVQRIPNADAIQGQMEMAMKGHAKAEPYFSPIPISIPAPLVPVASMAPVQEAIRNGDSGGDLPRLDLQQQPQTATGVDQGLEDPGLSTPVKDDPATGIQTSPEESDDLPAGSSPFQINGGHAHIDNETLLKQMKIKDHERLQKQLKMVETETLKPGIAKSELKGGEGSADPQASPAGEEDTEPGEKSAALQVPPAVEEVATPKGKRGKKGTASQASPAGDEETKAKPAPKRGKKGAASEDSPAGEEETKAKRTPKSKRGKKDEDDDEFKPTSTPKRGTKRAVSQASPAEEGIEPKPKRKRPYNTKKKRAEAEAAAAAAAKTTADEQNTAVPDPTTIAPVATAEEQSTETPDPTTGVPVATAEEQGTSDSDPRTSGAGESAPDTIPAENGMSGSSPTATDDTSTDQAAPLGELEAWIESAPLTPLTGGGLEDLEALFERTAARISRPGNADNTIDLTAIDAL